MQSADVMLCIDPFSSGFENDVLFEPNFAAYEGENAAGRYIYLRDWLQARGIEVHTADRLLRREVGRKVNLVMSFGLRKRYKALAKRADVILSAFFAFESPTVDPALYRELHETEAYFKRVYSFSDSESLRPVLRRPMRLQKFHLPNSQVTVREDVWSRTDRSFLLMINHNKLPALAWNELYTERLRALEFFARTGEIDLYGRGWDQPSFQMGIGWMPGTLQHAQRFCLKQWQRIRPVPALQAARRVYKGSVPSKIDTLGNYKFCICFENAILNGWVTEKIFECLAAGTIPIYWGAPDIERYVPQSCFIDMREFWTYQELGGFLKALGPSEIHRYKEAGRDYLNSPQFRPFSKQAFTELIARIIEEDTGIPFGSVGSC